MPGPQGERGAPGPQGEPGHPIELARRVVAELQNAVEELRAESETQLRRIADLQAQLDVTLGEFRHIQEDGDQNLRQRLQKRN